MFYVNDIRVTPTIFPDKTSQIWNLPEELVNSYDFEIRWEFEHEGEIMQLAQLSDLFAHSHSFVLKIKYLPYGRQDKVVSNKTTFALTSFAKLINSMYFDYVDIMDPHSKEALRLIKRSRAEYPTDQLMKAWDLTHADAVCYPDKGAVEKYTQLYLDFPYMYGEKVRDQQSGKILSYAIKQSNNYEPQIGDRILIVDDLCDGGATFVLLAHKLLEVGIKEVNLFVTHGVFSKGLKPLFDAGIKRIFTQDGEALEDWTDGSGSTKRITYRRL